jgi:hypothetical protein
VSSVPGAYHDKPPIVVVEHRDLSGTREGHVAIMLGGGDSFEYGLAGIPNAVDETFRNRQRVGSRCDDYVDRVE